MAVSISTLTTGNDTDGNSTSSTASITPSSNKLILLNVVSRTGITANPNQPTATGNGLTWVVVNSVVYDTTSSSRRRITTLRAMGASPSTGAISIDFGGQNQTNVIWSVNELTGTDTSGTNGSGAIVQSVANKDEAGTNSSFSLTLAAFSSTSNATFGAFAIDGDFSGSPTAGTGFTLIDDVRDSGIAIELMTEFRNDNDTSVDISGPSAAVWGGIAIEIKAATDATVVKDIIGSGLIPFPR